MSPPLFFRLNWLALARDVAVLYALNLAGGFLLGVAGHGRNVTGAASLAFSLGLAIAGFCLVGCWTTRRRWRQLSCAALILWLLGLAEAQLAADYREWLGALPMLLAAMAVGGGLSLLIAPPAGSER